MFIRSLDLVGASVVACAAVGTAFSSDVPAPVSSLLGLVLVFVLPGYAFTAAAWPSLGRWPEKVAFTLGSSIALAVIAGLVLNLMPCGLERQTWAVSLAAFTIIASVVGLVQREHLGVLPKRPELRLPAVPLLLFALALLVAVAAVGISRQGAIQADNQSKFTQLWMIPATGKGKLLVAIANREGSAQRYRVVLRAGRRPLTVFRRIRLDSGDRWERRVRLPQDLPSHTRVEADLYRIKDPNVVYRHVTFWSQ